MAKSVVDEVKIIINKNEEYTFLATKDDIKRMTKLARKRDFNNLVFAVAQAPKNSQFYKTHTAYKQLDA